MKKVIFVYPANRKQLFEEVKKGLSPDNALYGLNHLSSHNYLAFFNDINPRAERLLDILFFPFHKLFFTQIDIDFKLGRALTLLPSLNKSDAIIANTDGIGLAICLLKRLKLIRPPVIYAVGLFYIRGEMESAVKKNKETIFIRFYKWIISSADHILYHAPIEKEKLEKLGIYNPATCTFMPMGSDSSFFRSSKFSKIKKSENTITSVGKDRSRDYGTLFAAASLTPGVSYIVVCRKINISNLEIPKNVNIHFDLPYHEVAKIYHQASAIVIPSREMHRSSGQMTLTDCLQCAKPIIVSDIEGLRGFHLVNNLNVIKVPPEDPKALKESILKLFKDKNLQNKLIKNTKALAKIYSTKNYGENLSKVLDFVITEPGIYPIRKNDLEFMRKVRNLNRKFFFSSAYIEKGEQEKWFTSYLHKRDDYMLILKKGNKKIGFAAIYNIDKEKNKAEIGRFLIDERFRGLGYGKILLKKLEIIAKDRIGLKSLYLEVLSDNHQAINFYKNSGFIKLKDLNISGRKAFSMIKNLS